MKNVTLTLILISLSCLAWSQPKIELVDNNSLNPDFVLKGASPINNSLNVIKGMEIKPEEKLPKAIPFNYNGFKIEILESDAPLAYSHPIFEHFNAINIEYTNGKHYYTVGEFVSVSQLENYININIKGTFEQYRIIKYQDGKRINCTDYIAAH